jgi:hypothetical protein
MSIKSFDDLEPVRDVAARLGRSHRTLMRWTRLPDGLPFVRIGHTPYLHVPSTQQWIARRLTRPNPTRRRR